MSSNSFPHQPMSVAVNIQISPAAELHTGFRISFGIEFYKLYPVRCQICHKGYIMQLRHIMPDRDKGFILHFLDDDFMCLINILRRKRRQGDPTAADHSISRSTHDITAQRTDIKL